MFIQEFIYNICMYSTNFEKAGGLLNKEFSLQLVPILLSTIQRLKCPVIIYVKAMTAKCCMYIQLVRAGPLRARKMFLRVFCRWVYCTTKFRHTMSTLPSIDVSALTAFFRIASAPTRNGTATRDPEEGR